LTPAEGSGSIEDRRADIERTSALFRLSRFFKTHWHGPPSEWEHSYVLRRKRLIDGTEASGELMRRQVRGEWQYRRPTTEEEADEYSARQY
jgi:hypothetical protein